MSSRLVHLREITDRLEGQFDLEVAQTEALAQHRRWGLPEACAALGLIETSKRYKAFLEEVTMSQEGLQRLETHLEEGKRVLALFDPGLSFMQLWRLLIEERHSPLSHSLYAPELLRKINPGDLGSSVEEGKAAWAYQAAYEAASSDSTTSQPRLVFTPERPSVRKTSAIQDARAIFSGEMPPVLDPNLDLMLLRMQLDNEKRPTHRYMGRDFLGHEGPHFVFHTRYPLHVFPFGGVSVRHATSDRVQFNWCNPEEKGVRIRSFEHLVLSRFAFE